MGRCLGELDGARDGPPGLAAQRVRGEPGGDARAGRQVAELGHHAQVVTDRDVLAVQPIGEPYDVALADGELPAGGREGTRLLRGAGIRRTVRSDAPASARSVEDVRPIRDEIERHVRQLLIELDVAAAAWQVQPPVGEAPDNHLR
jgi:hypothetical protein